MRQKYKVYGGEWNKKLKVRSSKQNSLFCLELQERRCMNILGLGDFKMITYFGQEWTCLLQNSEYYVIPAKVDANYVTSGPLRQN